MSDNEQWIETRIASGKFDNKEALVQYLIDEAIENEKIIIALRAAIQEGLDSGESNRTVDDICRDIIARKEN